MIPASIPASSDVLESIVIICAEQSDRPATADSILVDDLGLDSLDMVELCMAIEAQFPAVEPMNYDPATMETVRDVARVVSERLSKAASTV